MLYFATFFSDSLKDINFAVIRQQLNLLTLNNASTNS